MGPPTLTPPPAVHSADHATLDLKRLREENLALCDELARLVLEARDNEEKQDRFERLEQLLIATRPLAQLVRIVLDDYRISFGLDTVSLVLVDPDQEIARLVAGGAGGPIAGLILTEDDSWLAPFFGRERGPKLGAFDPVRHGRFFGRRIPALASVAFLPITRQGDLVGSLNLGSRNPGRFPRDAGTHFLERLAALLGICLENALFHDQLTRIGLTDPLTGANNRRYFEKRLADEINQVLRHPAPIACMVLDLDHFKRINDDHGHQAGDQVLKQVAALMQSLLRTSDSFSRWGGEEFIALLPGTRSEQACEIAERIRARIAGQAFRLHPDIEVQVTVSIGLASLDRLNAEDGEGMAREIVSRADGALYRAKDEGRDRVVCADGT